MPTKEPVLPRDLNTRPPASASRRPICCNGIDASSPAKPRALFARAWLALAGGALMLAVPPAAAEQQYGLMLFQNDLFVGNDGGGYTNGIYLSSVRTPSQGEAGVAPNRLLSPLARVLGIDQATLAVATVGQGMVTPSDLSRRDPDPKDAPYAGVLAYRLAQVQVQGDTADLVALDVGVIGPASGAAQTQRFIHRVTGSDAPQGWDTQISNRPLFGLERARAWRLGWGGSGGAAAGDLIARADAQLGNLQSSAGGGLMVRYGTGLDRSFATTLGANGRGADPFLLGDGWFVFAGVSADRVFNHIGIAGEAKLRRQRALVSLGTAYGWGSSSLTFSIQSADPVVQTSSRRQTFGSITYVVRL